MEINSIKNSSLFPAFQSYPKTETKKTNNIKKDNLLGLGILSFSLASIGMASIYLAKKYNKTPLFVLKEQSAKLQGKLALNKPKVNPVIKVIGEKRDAEAVKLYQGYLAKKKIASLNYQVTKGDLMKKPTPVINQIISNKKELTSILSNSGLIG
ncbi:hypothetical protein II906_05705 [bacterium]|nr:hypothetical protein [bacterium]